MPIRMVEDDPGSESSTNSNIPSARNRRSFSGVGGLGGSLANILGALLPMLIKRPKILIALLIVGAIVWFFFLK